QASGAGLRVRPARSTAAQALGPGPPFSPAGPGRRPRRLVVPAPPIACPVSPDSPHPRQRRSLVTRTLVTDISVHPDLNGLPLSVLHGLAQLANNAAG